MARIIGNRKEADLALQLIAGAQKHLSSVGQLMFGRGTGTLADAEAKLEELATLRHDVEAARATMQAKIADERARLPDLRTHLAAFVALVKALFGNAPDVLADFGLAPKKARTPLTVEQKATAKAKRAATRKARGIIGKRKRQAVKGDVTGVVVTPVTTAQRA